MFKEKQANVHGAKKVIVVKEELLEDRSPPSDGIVRTFRGDAHRNRKKSPTDPGGPAGNPTLERDRTIRSFWVRDTPST
jgi:hypothetical protein